MIFGKRSEDLQVSFHPILLALAIRRVKWHITNGDSSKPRSGDREDGQWSQRDSPSLSQARGPSFIVGNGKEQR